MIRARLDQNSTGLLHSINNLVKKLFSIEIIRKTTSHVAEYSDRNKLIEVDSAAANILTLNADVFSAGNQFLVSQYGAGQITFTAGPGVTIRSSGNKYKTSAINSLVTVIVRTPTDYYIAGDLTA